MRSVSLCFALGLAAAATMGAPAYATQIGSGTVSVSTNYVPTVDLTTPTSTYSVDNGATTETLGTGAFASVTGLAGTLNGVISFSNIVGSSVAQSLPNLFVFDDGTGGTYNFTASTALTRSFDVSPGVSSSISLYLLGRAVDTAAGLSSTPTSLTLSFNSTGGSAFSSAATLAVPPNGAVPEPVSWAMMVMGFGLTGGILRGTRPSSRVKPSLI